MNLPYDIGISPTLKIRGMIATRDIEKGEVVERCPVILVEMSQEFALKQTVLWKYYFEWTKKHHSIVLGYGALINHSYSPNARYYHDFKNQIMVYCAIKPIKKGQEVFVNYNWDPDSQDPVDDFLVDFDAHRKR